MRILITGACGFIGHHIVEHILLNTEHEVIGIDKLSYASNGFNRLRDAECLNNPRLKMYSADFSLPFPQGLIQEIENIDVILHVGAETHVDNSIQDPSPFVIANVVGTLNVLNFARTQKNLVRFIYFSTDEVFGPAGPGIKFKEWDRYNSTNPYAATKAGGEQLCMSFSNTYKIPLIITNTMNAFGERQHPEKFIPSVIKRVLKDETVLIHSDVTRKIAGSRFYIHCRNIASAVLFLIENAQPGSFVRDRFNIVGEQEVDNLEMAKFIADVVGKPLKYEMIDFHSSRPGHDLRYALDGAKLEDLGWDIPKTFHSSLAKTINWYLKNPKWLDW
jgi:dTDP-glucose 4,6-dehydratase